MDENQYAIEKAARIEAAVTRYAEFLALNPDTQIIEIGDAEQHRLVISAPWNDKSVALLIPEDDDRLHSSLAFLQLPSRYSAIYHVDTKRLEVVWTAYKLDEQQTDLWDRKFTIEVAGIAHRCHFTNSSERLLDLARELVPLGIPSAEFRNLRSFNAYVHTPPATEESLSPFGRPVSFWIDDVEWDDAAVAVLVRHINFYLRYYDSMSPTIAIHSPFDSAEIPRNRYILEGGFPSHITSRTLDTTSLLFWAGSIDQHPSTAFLNFYRIIEYVSYNYSHDAARAQLLEIISRPHALSDPQSTSTELLLVLRELKLQREQDAIISLLKLSVRPQRLWTEVSANRAIFEKSTVFEGGLTVERLITEKDTAESFGATHVEKFARGITAIRNALAHGRDTKSADTILPLVRNFYALEPWLHLIAAAAGEVVLFDAAH